MPARRGHNPGLPGLDGDNHLAALGGDGLDTVFVEAKGRHSFSSCEHGGDATLAKKMIWGGERGDGQEGGGGKGGVHPFPETEEVKDPDILDLAPPRKGKRRRDGISEDLEGKGHCRRGRQGGAAPAGLAESALNGFRFWVRAIQRKSPLLEAEPRRDFSKNGREKKVRDITYEIKGRGGS